MSLSKVLTNEVLKGLMVDAFVYRGTMNSDKDLNDFTTPGVYLVNRSGGEILNHPNNSERGLMMVFKASSTCGQLWLSYDKNQMAYRLNWYGIGWGGWKIIAAS